MDSEEELQLAIALSLSAAEEQNVQRRADVATTLQEQSPSEEHGQKDDDDDDDDDDIQLAMALSLSIIPPPTKRARVESPNLPEAQEDGAKHKQTSTLGSAQGNEGHESSSISYESSGDEFMPDSDEDVEDEAGEDSVVETNSDLDRTTEPAETASDSSEKQSRVRRALRSQSQRMSPRATNPLAVEDLERWSAVRDRQHRSIGLPRLTQDQVNALRWARRFLFSVLTNADAIMEKEPSPSSARSVGFDENRLREVMRTARLAATDEEIQLMMSLWAPTTCGHPQLRPQPFCRSCWEQQAQVEERQEIEKRQRRRERKPRVSLNMFPHPPRQCTWEQFMWIFDHCHLKAEKNGRVW